MTKPKDTQRRRQSERLAALAREIEVEGTELSITAQEARLKANRTYQKARSERTRRMTESGRIPALSDSEEKVVFVPSPEPARDDTPYKVVFAICIGLSAVLLLLILTT